MQLLRLFLLFALTALPRAAAETPSSTPGVLQAARTLLEAGDARQAKPTLEQFLKANAGNLEASQLLARVYLLEGRPQKALETLLAFSGPSAGPEYNWILGQILLELGRGEESLAQFRLAATYGSDYRYAMDWGAGAWRLGRTEVALSAYTRAQALAPLEPWPRLNRAMILVGGRKPKEALEGLNSALRMMAEQNVPRSHPAYPDLYYWSGQALEALSRRREARAAYVRALEYDPNYSSARKALEGLR